jgi:3-demethoxyubiquinol 3-hydroxylase
MDDTVMIARILKVNHAGEHGAIRIYTAQIAIARILWPDIVPQLSEMLGHEIRHRRMFADAMPKRNARPCRALFLWAWGGFSLGVVTALLGRRLVWICTEAVEEAVHHHLSDQLHFLQSRDPQLFDAVAQVQSEELMHLETARTGRGTASLLPKLAGSFIFLVTDVLIWMSTSGDSVRLRNQLRNLRDSNSNSERGKKFES